MNKAAAPSASVTGTWGGAHFGGSPYRAYTGTILGTHVPQSDQPEDGLKQKVTAV